MRLAEYLTKADLDDETFAKMVGGVSKHAVKKWRYGEREPEAQRIARIEVLTEGQVTLRDWYPDAATGGRAPSPSEVA